MRPIAFLSVLAFALVAAGGAELANAAVFTDGFEDPTLDPYWSTLEESGWVALSSTGEVHGGNQAAQLNSTYNTGHKNIWLIHDYGQPMYGRVSVWLYDTSADMSSSNYLEFHLLDSEGVIAGTIGTPDNDFQGRPYYAGFGPAGHVPTTFDMTQGWHLFEIEVGPDSATAWIDGTEVAAISTGVSFQTVWLGMFGPTWRPAWVSYWDDFAADVTPVSEAVPTVSEWGLIVMTLLVLTATTLVLVRRCRVSRVAG